MADWRLSFIIKGSQLDPVLEMLHPFKVQDFDQQIVAGTPKRIRAGDKPGWQVAAEAATKTPQPRAHFRLVLTKSGFTPGSAASAIDNAVKHGALKRSKKNGVLMFSKP